MTEELQASFDPVGDELLEQLSASSAPRGGEEAGRSALESPKPEAAPEQKPEPVAPTHHFEALMLDQIETKELVFDRAAVEPAAADLLAAGLESTEIRDLAKVFMGGEGVYEGDQEETMRVLRARWGPHEFDRKLNGARSLVAKMSESTRRALGETGWGDHPDLIEKLAEVAERHQGAVAPVLPAPSTPGQPLSPQAAKAEYEQTMQSGPEHPYFNAEHPGHAAAVKKMSALASRAFDWE